MRSARTDRLKHGELPPRTFPAPRGARRVAGRIYGVVLLSLLLTACATGSAEEARRGQASEANLTPRLPARQATRVAEEFFPPTPTSTPSPVPAPALEALVLTMNVGADGAPQQSYASVPTDAGRVFVAAHLTGTYAGQVVTAVWIDEVGNPVNTARVDLASDTARQWVALPMGLNGSLPPGEYAVYLFVDDRRLSSLAFQLTGPGTGPSVLPELPRNPQVDRPVSNRDRDRGDQGASGGTDNGGGNQIIAVTTTP